MGKNKLEKFADMASYPHVFEYPYSAVDNVPFEMKGNWHQQFFKNDNPIVLELGCGRGEYTVGLGRMFPDKNFIGVDIKGARMWTGATESLQSGMKNVAFLRTNIEIIDRFFAPGEVSEIWLTFSDPQMKKATKRLTSTYFMERYRKFLKDGGTIHVKTDSNFMFTYTKYMIEKNGLIHREPFRKISTIAYFNFYYLISYSIMPFPNGAYQVRHERCVAVPSSKSRRIRKERNLQEPLHRCQALPYGRCHRR